VTTEGQNGSLGSTASGSPGRGSASPMRSFGRLQVVPARRAGGEQRVGVPVQRRQPAVRSALVGSVREQGPQSSFPGASVW